MADTLALGIASHENGKLRQADVCGTSDVRSLIYLLVTEA